MDLEFMTSLLMIIGIDIALGGDNAIVIALACRNLPLDKRNKAIFLGTGLAIVVRVALTMIVLTILKIPFIHFIGGLLLIYIAINLLIDDDHEMSKINGGTTLLAAVRTIVFADIVMGSDNVIAIAGASHDNIYLVISGLLVSVPVIVWGSKLILYLMEKYPIIIYIGAGILAVTAGKMMLAEAKFKAFFTDYNYLNILIPIGTIIFVLCTGYFVNKRKKTKQVTNSIEHHA